MTKKHKTMQTLGQQDCRWPIGDPQREDFHFCGARQVSGRPYCELHMRAAFQPSKPRYPQAPVAHTPLKAA